MITIFTLACVLGIIHANDADKQTACTIGLGMAAILLPFSILNAMLLAFIAFIYYPEKEEA